MCNDTTAKENNGSAAPGAHVDWISLGDRNGYGVLTHLTRIVDTGDVTVAFDGVPFEEEQTDTDMPTPERIRVEPANPELRRRFLGIDALDD